MRPLIFMGRPHVAENGGCFHFLGPKSLIRSGSSYPRQLKRIDDEKPGRRPRINGATL
jgi:hypothetical protein